MSVIKRLGRVWPLWLIALVCLGPISASAQNIKPAESAQSDHDQTLRQLLTEVRELRLALERATVTNTRFQMLIERLKAQQTQVDLLDRKLADVRSQLVKLKAAKTDTEARIKEFESKLGESSGEEHAALEHAMKEIKRNLEANAAEETQELQAEADLMMRLPLEQNRLTDINNQLDLLLREMKGP